MEVKKYNKVIMITNQGRFVVNPSSLTSEIKMKDIIAYDQRDWGGGIEHFIVNNIWVINNNLELNCSYAWVKDVYPSSEKVDD